ncbi:TonB-dependent siderophore receptor [Cernens ardua]|uniref:TonB-dependent siderophore receptor n=1 Tax=Cernens ardua TaxID=3402176 RepID=UPI003F94728B
MKSVSKQAALLSAGLLGGVISVSTAIAQQTNITQTNSTQMSSAKINSTPVAAAEKSATPEKISSVATSQKQTRLSTVDVVGSHQVTGENSYATTYSSTADMSPTSNLDQAQTTNTVTHQQIKDLQPQTLDDAVNYIPGVAIGNNFGGTQDGLLRRGFGEIGDGGILMDGVRQPVTRSFDAVTTERVEVLKGPASLLYGMGEPGGVINIITKKPLFHQQTTLSGNVTNHGGGDGSFDTTGPMGNSGFAYRVIGERNHEGYWREYGHTNNKLFAPSISYVGKKLSSVLEYQYLNYDEPLDRGSVWNGNGYWGSRFHRIDAKGVNSYGIRQSVTSQTEYRFNDDNRVRLTAAWNNDEHKDNQIDSRINKGKQQQRFRRQVHSPRSNSYFALDYMTNQQVMGIRNDILLGADYQHAITHSDDFLNSGWKTAGMYSYDELRSFAVPASNSGTYVKSTGESVYAKDNIYLNDQWIVAPGIRYQHLYENTGQDDGPDMSYRTHTNASKSKLLPFIGVVYKWTPNISLYGNYSTSFSPNEVTSDFHGSYKPSTGRQGELGIKYQNENWQSQLAFYHIVKKNVVAQDSDGLGEHISGERASSGIEWSLTGRISKNWSVLADYAYTHTNIHKDGGAEDEGNSFQNVPKNQAGAFLSYHVPTQVWGGQLNIGSGVRYVGRRAGDDNHSFSLPGYVTADAFVGWSSTHLLGHLTSFQINAGNLTNKNYFASSGGSTRVAYGQGRTFRFTGSVTF